MSYSKIEYEYTESINALETFIKSGEQSPERLADLVTVALDACINKAKAKYGIKNAVDFDYNLIDGIMHFVNNCFDYCMEKCNNPLNCVSVLVSGYINIEALKLCGI